MPLLLGKNVTKAPQLAPSAFGGERIRRPAGATTARESPPPQPSSPAPMPPQSAGSQSYSDTGYENQARSIGHASEGAMTTLTASNAQKVLRDREQELRTARDELAIKVAERTSELRRSERELRDVVDTIPAIVWSALPDGSNAYVNRRFVEYSGISAEQMAGSGWHDATYPDDLERHESKWLTCVGTGEPSEDEVRIRRADGQYRWHLQRGVPLRDEDGNILKWYGVLTDIEDRKRAEDKIRAQEAELRQILDLAPQQVVVLGPGGERLYANRVALDYVGLSLEEWQQVSGNVFRPDWFHPDDRERAARAYSDSTRSGGSAYEVELRVRGADGNYRW